MDGVYNAIGNTLEILANSEHSAKSLQTLADALTRAQKRNASREEIKATIQEHAPELGSIADLLPQTRTELYAFVKAIGAIITALIAIYMLSDRGGVTEQQKSEAIDSAIKGMVTGSVTGGIGPNRHQRRAQEKKARHK